MHSPLIVGITIALLFSLGTFFVQIQSVQVDFAAEKDFSISRQKRLSMPAMRVRGVRCAIFLLALFEEEDKENAPPSTTESVGPTEPPRLQRSRAFGARIENVPEFFFCF